MDKLDQSYLIDLVRRARQGNANAFAELFTATGQRQFNYIFSILGDKDASVRAMREALTLSLSGLSGLTSPELYLPWLCRLSFRRCGVPPEKPVAAPWGVYTVAQLLQLPLAESQVLLMRYAQGFSAPEIEDTLNFSPGLVRRLLRSGKRRLLRRDSPAAPSSAPEPPRRHAAPRLDALTASGILDAVFVAGGRKPNTVPMEALASYTVYRRERFSLQRGVAAAGLALFFLLPLLFTLPRCDFSVQERGDRGLPVYTLQVSSLLPVNAVTAQIRSRSLPVYEAGAKLFTVEPTRNGDMVVTVRLVNRQSVKTTLAVTAVDAEGPRLLDSLIGDDTVELTVADAGIGVNYLGVYALAESGQIIRPLSTDEASGRILFAYPQENWDVYIPDHIGNLLHLALTLE